MNKPEKNKILANNAEKKKNLFFSSHSDKHQFLNIFPGTCFYISIYHTLSQAEKLKVRDLGGLLMVTGPGGALLALDRLNTGLWLSITTPSCRTCSLPALNLGGTRDSPCLVFRSWALMTWKLGAEMG